jgi:hypothetical protein
MELTREGARYRNSLGELADLEPTHLYPMLKSSDLANGREGGSSRFMLVTQRSLADSTEAIRRSAPKTWRYLQAHASPLDGRASRIYRDRPRFSIFGVGPYSFSKWKVAVSGLYKKLCFRLVGPREGKPTVLDDTCYFLPAENAAEAFVLTVALNSPVAAEFLGAFIFWDEMRPIKKDALGEIDIDALVARLGADYFRDRMGEAPARVDAAALFSQSPSPVRDGTMPAVGVSPRSPSLHRRVP